MTSFNDNNPFEVKVRPSSGLYYFLVIIFAAIACFMVSSYFVISVMAKQEFVSNRLDVCFANNFNDLKSSDSNSFLTILPALNNRYVNSYLRGDQNSHLRIRSYLKRYNLYGAIPAMEALRLQGLSCRHKASVEFSSNEIEHTIEYLKNKSNSIFNKDLGL